MAPAGKYVFINCPFDNAYLPLFRASVFTVVRCGFVPRCALEIVDGAATRISKIERLIEECPLGIHDISRTELDEVSGLPRFNMPLEHGLFLGARRFGDAVQRRKKCLVLDRERYRYQMFMSDISGQDIEPHGGEVGQVMNCVRTFLNSAKRGRPLPAGAAIAADYEAFTAVLPELCNRLRLDPAALEYRDFAWIVADYVSVRP